MLKGFDLVRISNMRLFLYATFTTLITLISLNNFVSAAPVFTPLVQLPDTGVVDPTVLDFSNSTVTLENGDIWFHYSRYNTGKVSWLGKIPYGTNEYSLYNIPVTNNSHSKDRFFIEDGELWFTGYKDKITKIDTSGATPQLTHYPLPIYGTFGYADFHEGLNGNYYYFADSKIVEVTKSLELVRSISVVGFNNNSRLITDKINNVWIANFNVTGILRKINLLDTTQIQDFQITTQSGSPWFTNLTSIVADRNNNIWLSQSSSINTADFLTRMTPSGAITNWNMVNVANLFVGPDENIHYTYNSTMLGSIDIDTDITYSYDFENFIFPLGGFIAPDNSMSFAYRWEVKDPTYISNGTAGIASIDFGLYSPPTVLISSPISGSKTNSSSFSIDVNANDDEQVAKLELYINGILTDTINSPGSNHTFIWNTTNLTDGSYTITAKAYDKAYYRYTATSSPVTITIDKTKPTAAIISPISGSTVKGLSTVSASASDLNGIAGVHFKINGKLYGSEDNSAPYSLSWDTTALADGTYSISAVARDMAGNTQESSAVSMSIANTVVLADVTICHFPGRQNEQTLSVAASAVSGHLGHGDYSGRCLPAATSNTFNTLDFIEELEEITVLRQTDNTILATIDDGNDLSSVNIDLREDETLQVDGLLGSVNVKSGATIKGNGKVKSLVIEQGAYLAPGSSPGCLTTEGLLLEGTYTFELGGLAACTEHDQVIVNGNVKLSGLLEIELENGYKPQINQSFIIISNDGTDAVNSTFTELTEGGLTEIYGVTYRVSYAGGDGNDVELTITAVDETMVDEVVATPLSIEDKEDSTDAYLIAGVIIAVIAVVIFLKVTKPSKS